MKMGKNITLSQDTAMVEVSDIASLSGEANLQYPGINVSTSGRNYLLEFEALITPVHGGTFNGKVRVVILGSRQGGEKWPFKGASVPSKWDPRTKEIKGIPPRERLALSILGPISEQYESGFFPCEFRYDWEGDGALVLDTNGDTSLAFYSYCDVAAFAGPHQLNSFSFELDKRRIYCVLIPYSLLTAPQQAFAGRSIPDIREILSSK